MKIKFTIILLVFSLHAWADPVVQLNDLLSAMQTLQVDFTMEIRNQADNELVEETNGQLSLQRPGYFNVHTREPFEQYLISDRQKLWTYDVEVDQATVEAVDERLQQTPFLLLSGDIEAIRANFKVYEPVINGKQQRFTLSPLDTLASYDNVVLRFDDKILKGMSWTNSLDEKNNIEFSKIRFNQKLPDNLFTFIAPEGVLVTDKNGLTVSP